MKICTHCDAGILEPNKPWIRRGKIVCRRCFEALSAKDSSPQRSPAALNPYAGMVDNAPIPAEPPLTPKSANTSAAMPLDTPAALEQPLPVEPAAAAAPMNGYGLAGLIISVMGIFTAGLVSPLGLGMCFVGLKTRPRGMAIAGMVLSAIGTANLIRWIILVIVAWHQRHHGW